MSEIAIPDVRLIPIEEIDENDWNPNAMPDDAFNRLCAEIENVGFIDPIQVVPVDGGRYRILGGAHRYGAAKVLGMEKVPAVVLSQEKWKDVDLQKFVTVRLNMLRGKMNPEKFIKLYEEMAAKYGADALQNLMGVVEVDAWAKLTGGVADALRGSGLPKEVLDKFEDSAKELRTVDGLSHVLNQLFTDYGDTLRQNFMVFTYGSKEHLFVACDGETYREAKAIADRSKGAKVDINEIFHRVFKNWEMDATDLPPITAEAPDKAEPEIPPVPGAAA